MISRSRSGPTAAAISIEWTTSANNTVTCLYSAGRGEAVIADPQLSQKRAFRRGSVPHVAHAKTAPITTYPLARIPLSLRIGFPGRRLPDN